MLLLFTPIFLDISTLQFVLDGGENTNAPVHLGFLVLGIMIFCNFMKEIYKGTFKAWNLLFAFIVMLISPFTLLVSDVNYFVLIQFLSLLIYLSFGLQISTEKILFIFKLAMFVNTLQLLALVIFNFVLTESLLKIVIYQSLVTFPATLMLYCYCLLCFIPTALVNKDRILIFLILFQVGLAIVTILELGRKVSLIDLFIFSLVFSSIVIYYNVRKLSNQFLLKRRLIISAIIVCPIAVYFFSKGLVNSNILLRLRNSIKSDDLDGSRLTNWSDGLHTSFGSVNNLLFGARITQMEDINFHNYFFDTIVRFGLPVTVVIFIAMLLIFQKLWRCMQKYLVYKAIFLGVCANLVLHSTINSALSQSMYITCLVLILGTLKYFATNKDTFPIGSKRY